jgi:Fe-S-cluster containining protein
MSRGQYGFVYLTMKDRKRMAKGLGIKTSEFTRRYCAKTDGWFHLKDPEKDCLFLDGKRCSVYESRPAQCRTWPFWPENMNSKTWSKDVSTFCPGVGKGRLYSAQEIEALMKLDPLQEP